MKINPLHYRVLQWGREFALVEHFHEAAAIRARNKEAVIRPILRVVKKRA